MKNVLSTFRPSIRLLHCKNLCVRYVSLQDKRMNFHIASALRDDAVKLSAVNYLLFIVFSIIVAAAGITLLLAYVKHRRRLAAVRQQQQRYVTKLIRQHVVYRSNDVIEITDA